MKNLTIEQMKDKLVQDTMDDKFDTLEHIVEHWFAELSDDEIKEYYNDCYVPRKKK
jgi:predicted phosphoribosyltransferase